jgi:predicted Rdx family selenoprotein
MPKAKRKTTPKKKSNRKTSAVSTAKKDVKEPAVKVIYWKDFQWTSTARNWRSEYQKRMATDIFDPWVNPETGCYYTIAAQNYRDNFLVFAARGEELRGGGQK